MNILTSLFCWAKCDCDAIKPLPWQYLKGPQKTLQISVFANYLHENLSRVTYPFYCIFRELPKFYNFSGGNPFEPPLKETPRAA